MRAQPPTPITVIRSPREKPEKCSLRFLAGRPEVSWLRAEPKLRFDATGFLLLQIEAPPLAAGDAGHPLLLLDCAWRHLPALLRCVTGTPIPRSLPGSVRTAYPRKSKLFTDPARGLASIEALFVAKLILGERDDGLLAGYYWREAFLAELAITNQDLFPGGALEEAKPGAQSDRSGSGRIP